MIIVDNVVRDGELANAASDDVNVQSVRRLHDMLAAEPRVTATTLQTVGAKGYDGFTLAVVNACMRFTPPRFRRRSDAFDAAVGNEPQQRDEDEQSAGDPDVDERQRDRAT